MLKGGMSSGQENKFDAMNGSRGIDPKDVVKIAQRNGVYPNKHGVLPEKPNSRIMAYVKQYANSPEDVRAFEREWYLTVKNQLDKKHERIRTESREATAYDKNEDYYRKFGFHICLMKPHFLKSLIGTSCQKIYIEKGWRQLRNTQFGANLFLIHH